MDNTMNITDNRKAFLNYQNKVVMYRNSYSDSLAFRIGHYLNAQGKTKHDMFALSQDKLVKYNEKLLVKDIDSTLVSFVGYTYDENGELYRTVYEVTEREAYDRVQHNLRKVVNVFYMLGRVDLQELLVDGQYQYIDSLVLLYTFNHLSAEAVGYFMN